MLREALLFRFKLWHVRWRGRCSPGGAIVLTYHSVARRAHDPFQLAISPDVFRQQMEWLRDHCQPVPLCELDNLRLRGKGQRWVAVTFDDGYRDNLTAALPILRALSIPATVFVTTRALEQQQTFWWERWTQLEREAPADRWPLFPWQARMQRKGLPQARLHSGARWLRALLPEVREAWLGREQLELGVRFPEEVAPLSIPELQQLATHPLIEVGAHTVHHSPLTALPPEMLRDEVERSKETLEGWLQRPVHSFSYPFGGPLDHSAATEVTLGHQVGFYRACINYPGLYNEHQSQLAIPRFQVAAGDPAGFGAWVERLFTYG